MRRTTRWMAIVGALGLAPPLRGQEPASFAVLPFESSGSYGQDKESFQALELSIPATLAASLGSHPGARVADAGTVRQALATGNLGAARRLDAGTAAEVGRAAGTRFAVTGTFSDFYGKFRITARLVDARSGQILEVVSNDDPSLQDRARLAAIIQALSDRVAQAAGLPANPAVGQAQVPTAALTDFGRGLVYEQRGDKAKAADAYRRALSSYPDYREAREGLARVR